MAIRTFNSVGGFSVGENPANIILANGDITTSNVTLTGNLAAANVKTDHLLYANGDPWDMQEAAGSNTQIQFNMGDNFAASANLTFVEAAGSDPAEFTVLGNTVTGNLRVEQDVTVVGGITADNFNGQFNGTFSGTVEISGTETGIVYIDNGAATSDANLIYNKNNGNIDLTGNINVTHKVIANTVTANSYFTGVFGETSNSQPNIHTLGNLTNVVVDGNANVNHLAASGNVKFTDSQFANKALPFFDGFNRVVANVVQLSYDSSTKILHTQKIEANTHIFSDGQNKEIPFLDGDKIAVTDSDFTYDSADGTLYTTRAVATGLVSAGDFYTAGNVEAETDLTVGGEAVITGNANVTSNFNLTGHAEITSYANIQANASIGTTLTVGANANVGANLNVTTNAIIGGYANVTGNVNAGNLNTDGYANVAHLKVRTDVDSHLIPSGLLYDLGSSTKPWRDLWLSGSSLHIGSVTVTDTSGNLTTANGYYSDMLTTEHFKVNQEATVDGDLLVGGNLTVGGTTTYINVSSVAIKDPLMILGGTDDGGNLTVSDSKDRGFYLKNYITGTGVFNQFMGWKTSDSEFQFLEDVSESGDVVSGTFANIRVQTAYADLFNGVFDTASNAQPNITSLGTLTGLDINGDLDVTQTLTVGTLVASGMAFPTTDGDNRQVLSTDGDNGLYWATIDTYKAANGTSNVTVNGPGPDSPTGTGGNVTISVAGTSNVVVVSDEGVEVDGNLTITGSLDVGAVSMSGVTLGDTEIKAATTTTQNTTLQTIATVALGSSIRGVFFDVKGECASETKYTVASITAMHDGTSSDYAIHGLLHMGGSAGSFQVVKSGSNMELKVTPAHGADTVWTTQYRTI